MNGKDLIKILVKEGWEEVRQEGWEEVRQEGSHHIMRKGNKTEVIPVHGSKDIPKGLLSKIMKRTGLK